MKWTEDRSPEFLYRLEMAHYADLMAAATRVRARAYAIDRIINDEDRARNIRNCVATAEDFERLAEDYRKNGTSSAA
jgi:hypothetical protein